MQTVRWRLFLNGGQDGAAMFAKLGRQLSLKISGAMRDVFAAIRERMPRA